MEKIKPIPVLQQAEFSDKKVAIVAISGHSLPVYYQ
jgi:hypothetical protein